MKLPYDPAVRRFLLPWAAILALLGLELLAMVLHLGPAAPFIAVIMAAIIVMGPMRLGDAPNPARIFALAGAFWLLVVLFGLGTLDPLTRHHLPTPFHSQP